MGSAETLKNARNLLLQLHKLLVDFERSLYEGANGPVSGGQFLNLLLENRDFAWLRKFSMLIVEIDEMFAQRDGFTEEQVNTHIQTIRELLEVKDEDDDFAYRYQNALQHNMEVVGKHVELRTMLKSSSL